jgi:carbon storage regulator
MLVLTRRIGQVVKIGDDVEVVLLSIQGDQARLGIIAPRSVSVLRAELVDEVREENRAAADAPRLLAKRRRVDEGNPGLKDRAADADICSRAR